MKYFLHVSQITHCKIIFLWKLQTNLTMVLYKIIKPKIRFYSKQKENNTCI